MQSSEPTTQQNIYNKGKLLKSGYLIGKTLGKGSFSKVKLGYCPEYNKQVAIKIHRIDSKKWT
jgi:serine/threonine protein kinase